jgi:hypothetical protein
LAAFENHKVAAEAAFLSFNKVRKPRGYERDDDEAAAGSQRDDSARKGMLKHLATKDASVQAILA